MAYNYAPLNHFNDLAVENSERELQLRREQERQKRYEQQLDLANELSLMETEEYGEDILEYMFQAEIKTLPDVASIDLQTEIQWFMRPYLLDFLIEAHAAFGLQPETLFLAVNILDRYCSKRVVYRRHYQLVGCTALLIAAKYGECSKKVPRIKELAAMCCKLYEEDMFAQMERHVMTTLDWYVGAPTVDGFLKMGHDQVGGVQALYDYEVEHMALYILELSLFHRDFVSCRPSELAKVALALANIILSRDEPHTLPWARTYDANLLIAVSQQLHRPSQVISTKYRTHNLSRASIVLEDFLTKHAAIARANVAPPPTPPSDSSADFGQQASVAAAPIHAPQKHQYPANMPYGCITPPITPDHEHLGVYGAGAAPNRPETPTPTPGFRNMFAGEAHHPPRLSVVV